jgi:hypothetical protein
MHEGHGGEFSKLSFVTKLASALPDNLVNSPILHKICYHACHSGGNDRFCARLKTDISASNSGFRGRTRSCLTFLERGRRDESKLVRHDLR